MRPSQRPTLRTMPELMSSIKGMVVAACSVFFTICLLMVVLYFFDMDALKYDIGELKDMLTGAKSDTSHVKRIVLACERDMENNC
jgi:hypothetical protein